jgi:hypothetical protein
VRGWQRRRNAGHFLCLKIVFRVITPGSESVKEETQWSALYQAGSHIKNRFRWRVSLRHRSPSHGFLGGDSIQSLTASRSISGKRSRLVDPFGILAQLFCNSPVRVEIVANCSYILYQSGLGRSGFEPLKA